MVALGRAVLPESDIHPRIDILGRTEPGQPLISEGGRSVVEGLIGNKTTTPAGLQLAMALAAEKFKTPDPFTLSQGQKRFDAQNNLVAQGLPPDPKTLKDASGINREVKI